MISRFTKLIPNPNRIPNTGAPMDPDSAISAYPVLAREVLTMKSGRELLTARTVIDRKDWGMSIGRRSLKVTIMSIRMLVRNQSHRIEMIKALDSRAQSQLGDLFYRRFDRRQMPKLILGRTI